MKILAVEDNPADREMLRELLPDRQVPLFRLENAGSLAAADEILRRGETDLVLLDLGLPDSQGIDTLRTVRKQFPALPVVVLTGFEDEETGMLALREGAQDYLVKGQITGPSLMRSIRYADERNRIEQELLGKNRELDATNAELATSNGRLREKIGELTRTEQDLRASENGLKRVNERLAILADASRLLLSSRAPEQIVQAICTRVMEDTDCQAFFNYLIEDGKERMLLNAWAGIPDETAESIRNLDFGAAVCGCVARDAVPMIAEDISGPDAKTDLVRSFGIRAYACHPLICQGVTIGTLSFGTSTRSRFSHGDLGMMRAIADLVATAMARRKAEDALHTALLEKEVLLSEIHHRVKNNLAAFISLLSLEGSYEDSPAGTALKKDLLNRARTMALIHETLYKTRQYSDVDMEVYLSTLVGQVVSSYSSSRSVTTRVEAPGITLDLARATPAGLIVNEIVTNSLKYAFPAALAGTDRPDPFLIQIRLGKRDGMYELRASDNGIGLPPEIDIRTTRTLGLKLVNFLARHQLRAVPEVVVDKGTEFIFRFPE